MNEQKSTETKDENSDLLSSRQASQNNSQYELPIAYRSTEEYCTDTVNIVEVLTPTIDTSVTLSVSYILNSCKVHILNGFMYRLKI